MLLKNQDIFGAVYEHLRLFVLLAHSKSILRQLIILRLGLTGHPNVVEKSKIFFADYFKSEENEIGTSLHEAIFKTVLKWGDNSTYEKMIKASADCIIIVYKL